MPHASKAYEARGVLAPISCPILSAQPGVRHGFFTRCGGVSTGLYASLNCGYGSGDKIETVAENRTAVARALGQPLESLCTAYQIHSPTAVTLKKPWDWEAAPEADALVTAMPGIALGILTADCLPILFADGTHHVIAAAHGGWRGSLDGVIEATLAAMADLGATPATTSVAIGPAIAQGSYEVGAEFHDRFIAAERRNQMYFIHGARPEHFLFDLKAYAKDRLRDAGVTNITVMIQDTCQQENEFFSFRRATLRGESVYGRQISAIVMEE